MRVANREVVHVLEVGKKLDSLADSARAVMSGRERRGDLLDGNGAAHAVQGEGHRGFVHDPETSMRRFDEPRQLSHLPLETLDRSRAPRDADQSSRETTVRIVGDGDGGAIERDGESRGGVLARVALQMGVHLPDVGLDDAGVPLIELAHGHRADRKRRQLHRSEDAADANDSKKSRIASVNLDCSS